MIKMGYAELVSAIIRPPRAEYELAFLGPVDFQFCGRDFRRRDFEVVNERGQRLQCSHWEPVEYPAPEDGEETGTLPCLVYMHGNSSARIEALPQLSLCLSLGITVVGLDFAGSGQSEGEFVSLGHYEKDDLKAVIAHLRASGRVSRIALWGRSMGAVTALMHGERDPSLAAMVLDSPFADFQQLADEMVDKGRESGVHVPRLVTRLALRMIKASIQSKAGFNILHLCPLNQAPQCFMPALFVAGRDDDFIDPAHARRLHDAYGGDKNLVVVDGDHNSMRPRFMFDSVSIFLQQTLQLNEEFVLPGASKWIGYPPWARLLVDGNTVYYDEEGEDEDGGGDGTFHYWDGEVIFDELGNPPAPMLRGGLTREEGILLSRDSSLTTNQLDVGMTQARQREIQNAVSNLLGGGHSSSYRAAGGGGSGQSLTGRAEWSCALCTLVNDGRRRHCEACGAVKPGTETSSPSSSASTSQRIGSEGGGEVEEQRQRPSSSSPVSPPAPPPPQPAVDSTAPSRDPQEGSGGAAVSSEEDKPEAPDQQIGNG